MSKALLVFIVTLTLPVTALALPNEKERHYSKQLERMEKKIKLNDEQKLQVELIFKQHHQKHKALKAETRAQIEQVLTTEQLEKLQHIKKQRQKSGEETIVGQP